MTDFFPPLLNAEGVFPSRLPIEFCTPSLPVFSRKHSDLNWWHVSNQDTDFLSRHNRLFLLCLLSLASGISLLFSFLYLIAFCYASPASSQDLKCVPDSAIFRTSLKNFCKCSLTNTTFLCDWLVEYHTQIVV